MKKISILFCLFLLIILTNCVTIEETATESYIEPTVSIQNEVPSWFLKLSTTPGILIGYGEGDSRDSSADKARNDIASQIEVTIQSEVVLQESGDQFQSTFLFEQTINSRLEIVLNGAVRLKEEYFNGQYYSAWQYDNRPMRSRALVAAVHSGLTVDESSLKNKLPFKSFLDNNNSSSGFQLEFQNGGWYLLIGSEAIPVSKRELSENFFPVLDRNSLVLKQGLKNGLSVPGLQPEELVSGQLFSLVFKPAKEKSYLNLFYIDNNGITQNLVENELLSGTPLEIPDQNNYDGFIAEKDADLKESIDLVLAVETSTPLDYASLIRKVTSSHTDATETGLYSYGLLLEQLNIEECSSIIIRIIK